MGMVVKMVKVICKINKVINMDKIFVEIWNNLLFSFLLGSKCKRRLSK